MKKVEKMSEKPREILNLANFPALFDDAYLEKFDGSISKLKEAVTSDTIRYKAALLKLHTNGAIDEDELQHYLKDFDIISFKNLLRLSIQIIQDKSLEEVVQSKDDSFAVYAKLHTIYLSVQEQNEKGMQRWEYLQAFNTNLENELKNASPDVAERIQKEIIENKQEIDVLCGQICQNQVELWIRIIESIKLDKGSEKLPLIKDPLPAALKDPDKNLAFLESSATIVNSVGILNEPEKKEDEKEQIALEKNNSQKISKEKKEKKVVETYHAINEGIERKLEEIITKLQSQLSKSAKRFTIFSYSTVIEGAHIKMQLQTLKDAKNSLFEHFDNDPNQYLEVLNKLLKENSVKEFSTKIINETELEKLENIVGTMSEIYGRASSVSIKLG